MKRLLVVLAVLASGCDRKEASDPAVRVLTLPTDEPPMADKPGKKEFTAVCVTCHSSRYVTNQPPLSRAKWTAEVEKMLHTYGAPIPPEMVAPVIDYLVTVNGQP